MSFNILSLSGGGYLGLYTISVLDALERKIGTSIASRFDLITGTSIGGILALGLANEVSAKEIKLAFEKKGEAIFSNHPKPNGWISGKVDIWRSFRSCKYDGVALRETVTGLLGKDTLLGDLPHRVLIPAVNMTKGGVQAFKTPYLEKYERDYLLNAVDIAMATSAAPTYFPIAEIEDQLFVDGGLYANSPDILALHEANYFLGIPDDEIRLLSIGTTTTGFSLSHTEKLNRGIVGWGAHLAQTMIAAQQSSVDFMTKHRLGDRYFRIDSSQSPQQDKDLALDVATEAARKTIRGMAAAAVQSALGEPGLKPFLEAEAEPVTMYHGRHMAVAGKAKD